MAWFLGSFNSFFNPSGSFRPMSFRNFERPSICRAFFRTKPARRRLLLPRQSSRSFAKLSSAAVAESSTDRRWWPVFLACRASRRKRWASGGVAPSLAFASIFPHCHGVIANVPSNARVIPCLPGTSSPGFLPRSSHTTADFPRRSILIVFLRRSTWATTSIHVSSSPTHPSTASLSFRASALVSRLLGSASNRWAENSTTSPPCHFATPPNGQSRSSSCSRFAKKPSQSCCARE